MDTGTVVSIAYFDGYTIDEVRAMKLEHEDLVKIAAKCFEYAHTHLNKHHEYMRRSQEILNLSDTYAAHERARRQSLSKRISAMQAAGGPPPEGF